jgi:NADH:ubiquinone oxidoreductase subunit E
MTEIDLTLLHPVLSALTPQGRSALLPALHAAQALYGYLPEPVAIYVGRLRGTLADVYGVIDFVCSTNSRWAHHLRVCGDPACALAGSDQLLEAICQQAGVSLDEVNQDGAYLVERASCLGLCEHAPAVLVGDKPLGRVSSSQAAEILKGEGQPPQAVVAGDIRLLTANCGKGRPTSLADYQASGGYSGLRKAFADVPQAVIAEVKAAGLVGRGAADPPMRSWRAHPRRMARQNMWFATPMNPNRVPSKTGFCWRKTLTVSWRG